MYIKNRMRKTIGSKIKLMAYQFEILIAISISKGNYKETGFYSTCKLFITIACHGFTFTGRRHESSGTEKKDFVFHSSASFI